MGNEVSKEVRAALDGACYVIHRLICREPLDKCEKLAFADFHVGGMALGCHALQVIKYYRDKYEK